jgi:type IV secretion system protein TrbL
MILSQNPLGGVGSGLGWVVGKIVSTGADAVMAPFNGAAESVADAVGAMLATLATMWIRLDVPNVWNGATSPVVQAMQTEVAPLVALLAVLGIIMGGIRLAWEQHSQPGFDLVQGLITLVIATGMGVPMVGLLTSASDEWAESMIQNATSGTDFGRNLVILVAPSGPLAPVLIICFGAVAILLSVAQIMLLAFRAVALVLMAGLLPLTAAMTTTSAGKQHFRKVVAWIVALAIYKPLAALVYVAAFRLAGTHSLSGSGIGAVLIGLTMMTLAVLALPILLRLLVPAVGALNVGGNRAVNAVLPKGARIVKGVM